MIAREAPNWLRERASELRSAGKRARGAYSGNLATVMRQVADAYDEAATVLERHAQAMEDEER